MGVFAGHDYMIGPSGEPSGTVTSFDMGAVTAIGKGIVIAFYTGKPSIWAW